MRRFYTAQQLAWRALNLSSETRFSASAAYCGVLNCSPGALATVLKQD